MIKSIWPAIKDWLIAQGDRLSQFFGGFMFVPYGLSWSEVWKVWKWTRWRDSPNDSISGAAHRWYLKGHYRWVQSVIDGLFRLFRQKNHCKRAFIADCVRGRETSEEGHRLAPQYFE